MRLDGKLTPAAIERLSKPGRYADCATLYLNVAKAGSKSWVQRLQLNGRRRDLGLGAWPQVTIQAARFSAMENLVEAQRERLARKGNRITGWHGAAAPAPEPVAYAPPLAVHHAPEAPVYSARRARSCPAFDKALDATIEQRRATWADRSRERTERDWRRSLDTHARDLMRLPVDRITRQDVLGVLDPIWTAKPEVGRKVRGRLKAVFDWALARGHVESNPAGRVLDGALVKQPTSKRHFLALPYAEVGGFMDTLNGSAGHLALRFLILTAARTCEVIGATWDEIDLDAGTWTVPADRMKAGRPHRVPLSDAALAVLEAAASLEDGSGLIFPSPVNRGRSLSNMTLTKAIRAAGLAERAHVHGFRSSFRDWCAENGQDRELAEAALAHVVGGVEGAYFRSDLFDRRRDLMAAWAAYLAS